MRLGHALPLLLLTLQAPAADLPVRVEAVQDGGGPVKLLLFDRAEGFRKEAQARRVLSVPARDGVAETLIAGLPPGRYALVAYHDQNGDGRLNLRLGMFPKEGYGLSNNPRLLGPPSFTDAAFELDEAARPILIRLSY